VLADMEILQTLPEREYLSGIAEVVKYGVILDESFFRWLENNAAALLRRDPWAVAHAVRESCRIKAEVVARDEHEHGDRALLNYGHTFGHVLESLTHYTGLLHGEAVALGMRAAGRLASLRGLWSADQEIRQNALFASFGLPAAFSPIPREQAWALMAHDKKAKAGRVRFVLPVGIGHGKVVSDVAQDDVDRAWLALEDAL